MKEENKKIELTDFQLGYINGMKHLLGAVIEDSHDRYLDMHDFTDTPNMYKLMHEFLYSFEKNLKWRVVASINDARKTFEEENSLGEEGEQDAGHQDQC